MLALLGPSSRKRKRTGTGTSSTASSSTASRSRTKAMVGRERNSTQPGGTGPSWARAGRRPPPTIPKPRGSTEAGLLPGRPPPLTHKDHCSLSILGDLFQQLQLVLGLRASDAGRRGWRRELTLGMQNGVQPSLLAALQPAVLARPDPGTAHSPLAPPPAWSRGHLQ